MGSVVTHTHRSFCQHGQPRTVQIRPALIIAGIVSLLVAGCAGHSFDCAIGEARSDCAPGTPGGEKRVQQEQEARTFSAIDDARCRSLAKDSQGYYECRHKMEETRKSF
jgi:hypothetical protein